MDKVKRGPGLVPIGSFNPFEELGQPGLKRAGGFVQEDFVNALQGQRGARLYREMMSNCAVVGAAMLAIKMLIRKVDWQVEPFSQDAEDVERAETIENMYDDMSCSFEDVLAEILEMIGYGVAPMEIVYKKRVGAKKEPGKSSRYDDGLIGWRKFALRPLETVEQWIFDDGPDGDGGVIGMIQTPPPKYPRVTIPLEKLLLFQVQTQKANPEGISMLRSAYFDWIILKRLIELSAIQIERDVSGIPVIKAPAEVTGDHTSQQYRDTVAVGENLRVDEQGCVIVSSAVDPETKAPLWDVALLGSPGAKQYDIIKYIERHEARIAMVIGLADWLMIGTGENGSRALIEPKLEMSRMTLDAIMDSIAEVFTRHAYPRLFALNGWPLDRMPKLKHGSVSKDDIEGAMKLLDGLNKAGADMFPDEKLTRHFYGMGRFPTEGRDEFLVDDELTGVPVRPTPEPELGPDGLPLPPLGTPVDGEVGAAGLDDPSASASSDEVDADEVNDDPEEKAPKAKASFQPRNRGGKWSPGNGDVMRALDLLQNRQRTGQGDTVAHGLPVEAPPFSPQKEYKHQIEDAKVEMVKVSDLIGTQTDVRRDRVRAFLENPYLITAGKRNLSGVLEDLPVAFRAEGKLYLQDGHHRLAAYKLMGRDSVLCRIVEM